MNHELTAKISLARLGPDPEVVRSYAYSLACLSAAEASDLMRESDYLALLYFCLAAPASTVNQKDFNELTKAAKYVDPDFSLLRNHHLAITKRAVDSTAGIYSYPFTL